MLKLLIGDLEPEEGVGTTWKHHNLRLSYVAQQSLHHLEDFVTVTPVHYIQERALTRTLNQTHLDEWMPVPPVHYVRGRP